MILGEVLVWFRNREPIRVLWGPLTGAFLADASALGYQVVPAAVTMMFTTPDAWTTSIQPPSLGSAESRLAMVIATFACVVFSGDVLAALGMPAGVERANRSYMQMVFLVDTRAKAALAAVPVYWLPWWVAVFIGPIVSVAVYVNAWRVTYLLALDMFHQSELAEGGQPTELIKEPWYVHFTDLHITDGKTERTEGGPGGNHSFEVWIAALASLKVPPSALLLTGDVVDHGRPEEWVEVQRLLAPLRERSSHILISPGNHDLLTAYNLTEATIAADYGHFQRHSINWLNGHCLRSYLRAVSELAPGLLTTTGVPLSDVLVREDEQFEKLWHLVEEFRNVPKNSQDLEKRVSKFIADAELIMPNGAPGRGWQWLLTMIPTKPRYEEMYVSSKYGQRWFDHFPLYWDDPDAKTRFVILNSVANELSLLGSAWGEFGEDQIPRLEQLTNDGNLLRLVVLVHHAPFRWKNEDPPKSRKDDIQRWACLATSINSAGRLAKVLNAAENRGIAVYLFCGHRHGGPEHSALVGTWVGGKAVEGASMADGNCPIVAAELAADGKLRLGVLATRSNG